MRRHTEHRQPGSVDEIWIVSHPPVFTLGQAGKRVHILDPGQIPIIQTDRGGQVTYHGPGQLVCYLLIDLRSNKLGIRALVSLIEASVIELLASYHVTATSRPDAPGVYVNNRKIASLGLRVRHGCSYHGLSLNIDMDLGPFSQINPCGMAGMEVTQMRDLGIDDSLPIISHTLVEILSRRMGNRPIDTR